MPPKWIDEALSAAPLRSAMRVGDHGIWELTIRSLRHEPDGSPTCREIEVLRVVQRSGWHAYWRPGIRHAERSSTWPGEVASIREITRRAPPSVKATVRTVRATVRGRTKDGFGWPDLVVWTPEYPRARFIEVKGPNERVRKTQLVWLDAAVRTGLVSADDIVIVRL